MLETRTYHATKFKFVNEEEQIAFAKKAKRHGVDITADCGLAKTRYILNDPWVYCVIQYRGIVVAGAAKRCTYAPLKDGLDPIRGRKIAFSRAIGNLLMELNT